MMYDDLIEEIVESYKSILNDNLIGIYLHGSYVMEGFNPEYSDLDFLVLVKEDCDSKLKRELVEILIRLEKFAPFKGFEMSVVKGVDTLNPIRPIPYLLHYSKSLKEKYLEDMSYICSGDDDPDLLAHLMVVKNRGVCAYGQPIECMIGKVSKDQYLSAVMHDLNDAKEGVEAFQEYYVLNICRTLMYLNEGQIASKVEGGRWALKHLPTKHIAIIEAALNTYSEGKQWNIGDEEVDDFLKDMFIEIEKFRF